MRRGDVAGPFRELAERWRSEVEDAEARLGLLGDVDALDEYEHGQLDASISLGRRHAEELDHVLDDWTADLDGYRRVSS